MSIDLHMHTIYSDGEYSPSEILDICHKNNVNIVSITDHNSIEGSKNAILVNKYDDILVIPGIEFSAKYELKGGGLHILGYNMNLNNEDLNNVTKTIRDENNERMQAILYALKKYEGISFASADIDGIFSKPGNIGKPEVAKLCVKYGYSKTVREAFDTILIKIDSQIPERKFKIEPYDCIDIINSASGIASLAHPITLKKNENELMNFIGDLAHHGLKSVEVYHSLQDREFSSMLRKITKHYDILYSCGSDFHGPNVSPNVQIGSGKNDNLNLHYVSILKEIMR